MEEEGPKTVSEPEVKEKEEESVCTPWEVSGTVNYEELVEQFGTEMIDEDLKVRFKNLTGHELHPWIKRGIFFTHRSLNSFLDAYENGEAIFLYTGRGPTSDAMHVGHLVPFMMLAWLQKIFDCPLVIQIADDEKYYFKELEFEEVHRMGFENAKDIIACGFNPEKTFIFSNRDHRLTVKEYEIFTSTLKKKVSLGTVRKIFGFGDDSTVGMLDWPFYQTAAAFSNSFPHIFKGKPAHVLIPHAIDQDPYFRMARDIAAKMNLLKPCSIMCTFIPPLIGVKGKMSSSSGKQYTIFLTDTPEDIKEKIMKYAFSGGGNTVEDHKREGGRPDDDISFQYLRYFEMDEEKLEDIRQKFISAEYLCGDVKLLLVERLGETIRKHQEIRNSLTDEQVQHYYAYKEIELPTPKEVAKTEEEKELYKFLDEYGISHSTIYHSVITTMEEGMELSARVEGVLCKNLLLRGPAGTFYIYLLDPSTNVKMKTLGKRLAIKKIRFAEKSALHDVLQVPQGCVTPFALLNDKSKRVTVIIDKSIPSNLKVNFHPLRNDATTTVSYEDMLTFLKKTGYEPIFIQEE